MVLNILPRIGLRPRDYLLKYVFPSTIISIIILAIGLNYFSGYTLLTTLTIPIVIMGGALGYPFIKLHDQKTKINEKLHVFISKFGVLSITDLDRKELIHLLALEKDELGQLADESNKIYVLLNRWNQSLAESCRFLSRRTPSDEFSDFLDRMSYSVDSGEDLKSFLIKEQDIVLNDYIEFYRRSLYMLDIFKEIYVSAITALSFLITFAIITPYIAPYDFISMVIMSLIAFVVLEILLVQIIINQMPRDKLWHQADRPTQIDLSIRKYLIISIILSVITMSALIWGKYIAEIPKLVLIPYQMVFAIGITPLLIGGFKAKREEDLTIRREYNFPDFLRSLGDSVSAKGGGMKDSLEYLSYHDFGPLTKNIKHLYKRMVLNIDSNKTWKLFGVETSSYLIQLFSEMFERCTYLGGNPGLASDIIGNNFRKIIHLRKSKYQSVKQFSGTMYGLAGGMALTLFTVHGVTNMINKLYAGLNMGQVMNLIHVVPSEDMNIVAYLMYASLILYSMFSAYLIKMMDGGHPQVVLVHFVIMVWVVSIVACVTGYVLDIVLGTTISIA